MNINLRKLFFACLAVQSQEFNRNKYNLFKDKNKANVKGQLRIVEIEFYKKNDN